MQILVDWGNENPEQVKKRRRREEEEEFERFIRMKLALEAKQAQNQVQSQATATVSASAGFSGGGGGGGAAGEPDEIFIYKDVDTLTWKYAILDFSITTILGPYDTGIVADDFYISNIYVIQDAGFVVDFINNLDGSIHTTKFISAKGPTVGSINNLSTIDYSIRACEGRFVVVTDYDAGDVWIFDGEALRKDSSLIPGSSEFIIGSQGSYSNTQGTGALAITFGETAGELKFWLVNPTGSTLIYESGVLDPIADSQIYFPSLYENSDKVFMFGTNGPSSGEFFGFRVYDSLGRVLQDITLPESNLYNQINLNYYGTDKALCLFWNDTDELVDYQIYQYDGATNSLQTLTRSRADYPNFEFSGDFVSQSNFNSWSYSENASLTLYYDYAGYGGLAVAQACEILYFFEGQEAESYTPIMPFGRIDPNTNWNSECFYFLFDDGDDALKLLTITSDPENRIIEDDLEFYTGYLDGSTSTGADGFIALKFANSNDNSTVVYYVNSIKQTVSSLVVEQSYGSVGFFSENGPVIVSTDSQEWYANLDNSEWTESSRYYISRSNTDNRGTGYFTSSRLTPGAIVETDGERIFWLNDASGTTDSIGDGGFDMFDDANFLTTNMFGEPRVLGIPYTHSQMTSVDQGEAQLTDFTMNGQVADGDLYFGDGSEYFTNLYPGFFVLSADHTDISSFMNSGNYGSDGDATYDFGSIGPITQNGSTYTAMYKKESDNSVQDPSIAHIVIVNIDGVEAGLANEDLSLTENYEHQVSDISTATRLHFLLVAKRNAAITTQEITDLATAYLQTVDPEGTEYTLANALARLNLNYGTVTTNLPSHNNVRLLKADSVLEAMIPDGFDRWYTENDQPWRMGKDCMISIIEDERRGYLSTIYVYDYSGALLQKIETDFGVDQLIEFQLVENTIFVLFSIDNGESWSHTMYCGNLREYSKATVVTPNQYDIQYQINDWVKVD